MFQFRSRVRAGLGKLFVRRIRRKGLDLSRFSFIPEKTKVPLLRIGTDPVPRLAEIRATAPMHKLNLPFDFTAYLVTGYDESRRLLTDRDSYSNDIRHMFSGEGTATADDIGGLGFTDPPLHTRLRKIITPEFTMRRLARLEPMIEGIVDLQLDALEKAGSGADLAKHLAFPIPFQTICAL
ncbi:MAG: cytochrome P450, partial [Aeromicrobium sp.]